MKNIFLAINKNPITIRLFTNIDIVTYNPPVPNICMSKFLLWPTRLTACPSNCFPNGYTYGHRDTRKTKQSFLSELLVPNTLYPKATLLLSISLLTHQLWLCCCVTRMSTWIQQLHETGRHTGKRGNKAKTKQSSKT